MMRNPIGRAVFASAVVLAMSTAGTGAANAQEPAQVPVNGTDSSNAIPEQYIVVMKPGTQASSDRVSAANQARSNGAEVLAEYDSALDGFAARLTTEALDGLRSDPNVAYIEADQSVALLDTQSPATQGLDRIDQRDLPLSNSYTFDVTASGVTAYVIDTGVRLTHGDFGGRATSGFDAVDGGSADDCNGHGTHVAGTVGGETYGVAKAVDVVAVRVLNCAGSGSNSGVIAGIDWVTSDHADGAPAVANMSLGGSASAALDEAVSNSIADGVTYAVAAGNENSDACNSSPARVPEAITVGSTSVDDVRSEFSNYGTCVDIFAPGSEITSTWSTSDSATNTISGTSMAAPHVAGAAALFVAQSPSASPQAVSDGLVAAGTPDVLTDPRPGSPNVLLCTSGA